MPPRTEIIDVDDVLNTSSVESVETIRIMWAIRITLASLAIATAALFFGIYMGADSLQNWATGLISAVAGAAITYGFNSRKT